MDAFLPTPAIFTLSQVRPRDIILCNEICNVTFCEEIINSKSLS